MTAAGRDAASLSHPTEARPSPLSLSQWLATQRVPRLDGDCRIRALGTRLFRFRLGAECGSAAFGEFQGLADRGGEEVGVAGGGFCLAGLQVGGVQGLPTLVSGLQVGVGLGVVRPSDQDPGSMKQRGVPVISQGSLRGIAAASDRSLRRLANPH